MSIGNQRALLAEYVQKQGWEVVDTYIDDGFSGTNFERPGFQEMMRMVKLKKIGCIVVKDDCVILELNSESPENTGLCDVSSVF